MKKVSPPAAKKSPKVSSGASNVPPVKKPTSSQLDQFDSAMKLFHKRDFAAALTLFEQAAAGDNREVSHVARQHANMCRQRLASLSPVLKSSEDYYHHGIDLIGTRKLNEARTILAKAAELDPQADHIQYAMGICLGLAGDLENAARHISNAIRLEPKNRMIARTDPDFLVFGRQSPLRELVFSEKKERDPQLPS